MCRGSLVKFIVSRSMYEAEFDSQTINIERGGTKDARDFGPAYSASFIGKKGLGLIYGI